MLARSDLMRTHGHMGEGEIPPRPLALLAHDLGHAASTVRLAALVEIGRLGQDGAPAVPSVLRAMEDGQAAVRQAACQALGQIAAHRPAVVPALTGALADPSVYVRLAAARALGHLAPLAAEASTALHALYADDLENTAVRFAAFEALEAIRRLG